MAKKVSNKKPMFGNNRPFSLKTSLKIQKPNMQKVTVDGKTVVMSAREAKKFKKNEISA
ncbi:MAG: 50S ribosomal protein L28 [Bacilli bacterium]|nr:50S ribosomal protein L28 [Bacilli bacterium]